MTPIVIGIDPGVSGAIAFLGPNTLSVHDIPFIDLPAAARAGKAFVPRRIDGRELALLVRRVCPPELEFVAFCERVQAMRPQTISPNQSMQAEGSLMRSLGAIEAVFDILRAPCELVLPQTWQAFYGLAGKAVEAELRGHGELPSAVRKARELYPELQSDLCRVRDHNRAEAMLIAHFASRKLVP